jgi:hypothetical protein
MTHTVRIDDNTRNGKKLLAEIQHYKKGIEFDNPAKTGKVPDGYVTGDEFEMKVKENIQAYCKQHGVL